MELVDIHNLEELQVILKSFQMITNTLGEELDKNSGIKNRLFKALAKNNVSTKLSEQGQLIELIKCGEDKIVEEYQESEKEVQKLKHAWKYAEHALNTKKHLNNILPKY